MSMISLIFSSSNLSPFTIAHAVYGRTSFTEESIFTLKFCSGLFILYFFSPVVFPRKARKARLNPW